jgi:hypothetical protein
MDQQPPAEDIHPNGRLIDEGLHLAAWFFLEMRAMLRPGLGARALRHIFRHYLRPAEAALRRAICLIADTLEPEPVRAITKPVHPRAGGDRGQQTSTRPRAPTFRLTESLPRPKTDYLPPALRPRISIACFAPPPPPPVLKPRAPANPGLLAAKLQRRLDAFDAAFRGLRGAARRLRRLRARRSAKRPLLCFLQIPGIAAKPVNAEARDLLERLNRATFDVFRMPVDTS